MRRFATLMTLHFALSGYLSATRPGGFVVLGPGGGGAMFHPTISPYDPEEALVACDMTGSFITHDGGATWRMFNLRGAVHFFSFDPRLRNVIYAQTNNLWRSQDDGVTWNLVSPAPSTIRDISKASDHGEETILPSQDEPGQITALVIDPYDSKHIYATGGGLKPALFESTDAAAHWVRVAALPEPATHLWLTGKDSRDLLAVGRHFVVRRSRRGMNSSPTPDALVASSAGLRGDGSLMIYGASTNGLFVSRNAGASWRKASLPGNSSQWRAIATSYHHPETAYASYGGLRLAGSVWHGVARTRDSGATWQLVWKESQFPAANINDAWITPRFGTEWGENPLNLGVADQNPGLIYATDMGRTMVSTNSGRTWNAAYSRRSTDGEWISTGLDVTTAYGIHFDPFNARHAFISYTDISLFQTKDGGRSWGSASTGIPKAWSNTTYWMTFDPAVKGRLWGVNSNTHDLPRPKMFRHTSTESYLGGVCHSEDGGRHWTRSGTGMPETAPTDILLDPASPVSSRTLYVAAFGRGVYKSVDGGQTWTLKNTGIRQQDPLAWRITLSPDRTLYLIVARRSEDGSIGNAGDGALYRSTDGADSWQSIELPAAVNGPNGLSVDPANPRRLYLAAWARATGVHGEGGGVYQSEDGGSHWSVSLNRDQHVYDVTVDPRMPGTVYASGFESSAWVSRDTGAHWNRIAGFNFKWGHRVLLDPNDAQSVYITTFGGGVWHGKVTTAPVTVDISTAEMKP